MKRKFTKVFTCFLFACLLTAPHFASAQSTVNFNVDVTASDYRIIKTLPLTSNNVGVLLATASNANIYLWVYNSSGTRVTNVELTSLINWTNSSHNYSQLDAISTGAGNIFITCNSGGTDYMTTHNARYIVVNETGALQTSGQINTTDPGASSTRFIQMDKLSNGKIVFLFQRSDNASYAFRIFNADGTASTANDVVYAGPGSANTFGGESIYTNRIAAGRNGNFLISLYHYNGTLRGFLFDNTGSSISVGGSAHFTIDPTVESNYNNNSIVALANGNFAAFWSFQGPLYGTMYFKIISNTGATVQNIQSLGGPYMGSFIPYNNPGTEGFIAVDYAMQDENDYSNPYASATVKRYNQLGALQGTTALQGYLIAPSYYFIPGSAGGYAYLYSYYKSYVPYPEDWYYDITSDGDIKGVTSAFAMGGTLPVTVINYTVKLLSNKKAQLTWSTASESNNKYFEIEKSLDGINFLSIGRVDAVGNSTTTTSYSFTDPETVKQKSWYRLKQFDIDGKEKSLGVKYIQGNGATIAASVYPNPVKGNTITINTGDEPLPMQYSLTDIQGRVMKKGILRQDQEQLDVEELSEGIYFLRIGANQIIKLKK